MSPEFNPLYLNYKSTLLTGRPLLFIFNEKTLNNKFFVLIFNNHSTQYVNCNFDSFCISLEFGNQQSNKAKMKLNHINPVHSTENSSSNTYRVPNYLKEQSKQHLTTRHYNTFDPKVKENDDEIKKCKKVDCYIQSENDNYNCKPLVF